MYDAIVIGARCAGSATAMLLGQKGYSVLALDRDSFPSDTVSTHIIKYPGVKRLERWDLLDQVVATNVPPLNQARSHFGDFLLSGTAPPKDGIPMIAPRRTVLDEILVKEARKAGTEVREEFVVRELLTEDDRVVGVKGQPKGGSPVTERTRIVIGAGGRNSLVARTVDPPTYDDHPPTAFYYYTYWSALPDRGLEFHWRHRHFALAIPTNDELTCLVVGRPIDEQSSFTDDIETNYHQALKIAPDLANGVSDREPEETYIGMAVSNFFRKPYGAGWALVGDSALCMDPLKGHGISDAFCDAELLANAIDEGFSESAPLSEALSMYEQERNARKAGYYDRNWKGSHLEGWNQPATLNLRAALRENQAEADRWAGTIAFSVDFDEFYSSDFVKDAMSKPA